MWITSKEGPRQGAWDGAVIYVRLSDEEKRRLAVKAGSAELGIARAMLDKGQLTAGIVFIPTPNQPDMMLIVWPLTAKRYQLRTIAEVRQWVRSRIEASL